MEKMLILFIMLCSVLLEVRGLQCYVCDNCPKVNEEELQTCGMQTTPGPSTIATTATQSTTPSTMESTTTPSTSTTTEPMTIPTKTTIAPDTTSTTIATDFKNNSTTTTLANTIATLTTAKPKTNYTTSSSLHSTIASESTTNSIATTTEPVTTSTTTIEPVTTSRTTTGPTTITTKPGIIPTMFTAEPTIPTEPMTIPTTTTTESSTSSTTITSPAEPIINFTTEPIMVTVPLSVTNYPESTNSTIKPVEDTNATYNFSQRRPRSLHEDCLCKKEKICDCLISKQRSKRYALRGLGLPKEGIKYVCTVDRFKVNETEVVKRGCAVMEEDDTTSCANSGFGENCKVCDSNQCNGVSIAQTSTVFMFIMCCIHYFSLNYIVN